jgi:hypothetical protein
MEPINQEESYSAETVETYFPLYQKRHVCKNISVFWDREKLDNISLCV